MIFNLHISPELNFNLHISPELNMAKPWFFCRFSLQPIPRMRSPGRDGQSAEECQHDFGGGHAVTVTAWLGWLAAYATLEYLGFFWAPHKWQPNSWKMLTKWNLIIISYVYLRNTMPNPSVIPWLLSFVNRHKMNYDEQRSATISCNIL
jgi:hypothetical protein